MRSILFTAALACGAVCTQAVAAAPADGWSVYTDLSIWQASDPVPIRQIDDDWTAYSPRAGRNAALMRNRVSAGVGKGRWRLGAELRQDAWLGADRESLDAYTLYQQKRKPAPPASFALRAQYFSWKAQGLRAGYTFDGPRFGTRTGTVEISGAVYGKQRLREQSVDGVLTYARDGSYGFDATHVDVNDRMIYPFMGDAPSASGASLSVGATLPLLDAWTLRLQADDVASRLRWKNLPVNTETLKSNVTSYDADGYLNFAPMLSGRKQQVERSVRIPRYTAAALDYRSGDWGAGVQVARYAGVTVPTFSVSRRFGWLTLRANVETRFDSAGIGIEAGNFRFMLQSDAWKLAEAKTRSLQLHYHLDF
jgi:hypothetical protein